MWLTAVVAKGISEAGKELVQCLRALLLHTASRLRGIAIGWCLCYYGFKAAAVDEHAEHLLHAWLPGRSVVRLQHVKPNIDPNKMLIDINKIISNSTFNSIGT